MDSGRHFRFVALAGAAPLALLAQPATAQTALDGQHLASNDATAPEVAATDEAAGDVVVTARRRSERAQDVPIALSVVSEESLRARGDYTLGTIQQSVPSLQVFSFNPRNTNVNIRGLGSNVALTNDGLENGVGIYIDQVYYGRLGQSQFELVDLDRIEVLRGPQGTLFGKNTTAGAINITSKAPTFDLQGFGEATGGNYGFHQVRGSISGGLIDNLVAARISISDTHRDGFISNITTGRKVHDFDNFTARGQLLITPTPNLTARIIADYGKQKQNCCIPLIAGVITKYDNGAPIANNFIDRVNRAGYTPLPFTPFARVTDAEANFQANMDTWGVSGQLDWDVGPVTLTSVTASRQWNWFPANDGDYTALPVNLKSQQQNNQRQFSQELRLASNGTNTIDYVVGAYYFYQIIRGYGASAYGSAAPKWLFPAQYAADPVATDAAVNGFEAQSQSTPVTRSYALFGQTVWHISDALSLTTGLRYTHEKKVGEFAQQQVAGLSLAGLTQAQRTAAQALRNQLNPITAYTAETSDDSLSGLATLSWKVTDDVLLYASYSRGYKAGGYNLDRSDLGPAYLASTTANPNAALLRFDPETVNSYEVGFKYSSRKFTLNVAGFRQEFSNFQLNTFNGTNYIVQNIGSCKASLNGADGDNSAATGACTAGVKYGVLSQGIEIEAGLYPARNFAVNLGYTLADTKYRHNLVGSEAGEALDPFLALLPGQQMSNAPRNVVTLSTSWTPDIGTSGLSALFYVDGRLSSDYNTGSDLFVEKEQDGYFLMNARVGLRGKDQNWSLEFWAQNLLNTNYTQVAFNAPFQGAGSQSQVQKFGAPSFAVGNQIFSAFLAEPRTYGVTLRKRF